MRQHANARLYFKQTFFVGFKCAQPKASRPGVTRQGLRVTICEKWMRLERFGRKGTIYFGKKRLNLKLCGRTRILRFMGVGHLDSSRRLGKARTRVAINFWNAVASSARHRFGSINANGSR